MINFVTFPDENDNALFSIYWVIYVSISLHLKSIYDIISIALCSIYIPVKKSKFGTLKIYAHLTTIYIYDNQCELSLKIKRSYHSDINPSLKNHKNSEINIRCACANLILILTKHHWKKMMCHPLHFLSLKTIVKQNNWSSCHTVISAFFKIRLLLI